MKFKIDIECTPEEARAFFGLPNVQPLQEAVLKEVQERVTASLRSMDPETLFRTWLPGGLQGWEQMQKRFWQQFGAGTDRDKDSGKKGKGA